MSEVILKYAQPVVLGLIAGSMILTFVLIEYQNWKKNNAPVQTARAVACYKDPEMRASIDGRNHTYIFYITFRTESGELLNLYMGRDEYYSIPEGAAGELTWQDKKLWRFERTSQEKREECV